MIGQLISSSAHSNYKFFFIKFKNFDTRLKRIDIDELFIKCYYFYKYMLTRELTFCCPIKHKARMLSFFVVLIKDSFAYEIDFSVFIA